MKVWAQRVAALAPGTAGADDGGPAVPGETSGNQLGARLVTLGQERPKRISRIKGLPALGIGEQAKVLEVIRDDPHLIAIVLK